MKRPNKAGVLGEIPRVVSDPVRKEVDPNDDERVEGVDVVMQREVRNVLRVVPNVKETYLFELNDH